MTRVNDCQLNEKKMFVRKKKNPSFVSTISRDGGYTVCTRNLIAIAIVFNHLHILYIIIILLYISYIYNL